MVGIFSVCSHTLGLSNKNESKIDLDNDLTPNHYLSQHSSHLTIIWANADHT